MWLCVPCEFEYLQAKGDFVGNGFEQTIGLKKRS